MNSCLFGKGRKEQEVGISPEVRKLLWKYLAKYRRPASAELRQVFLNERGQPLTINGVEQLLLQIKEQANIVGVRVSAHTFRHTFARRFLERGGDVYKLSRLTGHTDVKTTEKYRNRVHQPGNTAAASAILSIGWFRLDEKGQAEAQSMKGLSFIVVACLLAALTNKRGWSLVWRDGAPVVQRRHEQEAQVEALCCWLNRQQEARQ